MRVTPKETMKICQTLYEAGLITYMRTDSTKYSKEFLNTVKPYITKSWGEDYINEHIDLLSEGKKEQAKKTPKKTAKNQTKMIRKMIIMPKKHTKLFVQRILILLLHDIMTPKRSECIK